ncbi:MAG: hypothetical protein J0H68_04410 [Sphingobacteriia bacterium]|nr:hypothetical protein [Sphingobacteriia bacterium]
MQARNILSKFIAFFYGNTSQLWKKNNVCKTNEDVNLSKNANLTFYQNSNSFAIFDPSQSFINEHDNPTWWKDFEKRNIKEIEEGKITLFNAGNEGLYKVKVTTGDLTNYEKEYCTHKVEGLGLEVVSGKFIISKTTALSSKSTQFSSITDHEGITFLAENGNYSITIYCINPLAIIDHHDIEIRKIAAELPDVVIKISKNSIIHTFADFNKLSHFEKP